MQNKIIRSTYVLVSSSKRAFLAIVIALLLCVALCFSACGKDDKGKDRDIPKGQANQFVIMSTTDIHGKVWDEDLLTDKDEPNNILRASTAAKKVKDAYVDRSVLFDNGDLYQGTPVSTFNIMDQAAGKTKDPNPAAVALEYMKYDAYGLGNHEFNFEYDTMKNTYSYLQEKGIPCVCANLYFEDSGKRVFEPYMIKTINVDGTDVKIAIIGLGSTDCPRWDSPENYKNIIFHAPENPTCDDVYEVQKVQQEMTAAGVKADFTIVAIHSGLFARSTTNYPSSDYEPILDKEAEQPLVFGKNTEGQAYRLLKKTTGINMFITGHDHVDFYSNKQFKNAAGTDVLVVNGGCENLTKSVFNVSKNGETGQIDITLDNSENLPFTDFNEDQGLKDKIKPYAEKTDEYLNQEVGKIGQDWDKDNGNLNNTDYFLKQTDEMDLVGRAQIASARKNLQKKYVDVGALNAKIKELFGVDKALDASHGMDVDLSLSSVSVASQMHEGTFTNKDTYKLYKYDNTLCCIPMKGQDIKDLLEYNAENRMQIKTGDGGKEFVEQKDDKFSMPIFYGLNFTYKLNNSAGNKVEVEGFANGQSLELSKTYLVAINNYQLGNISNDVLARFDKDKTLWSQNLDNPYEFIQDYIAEFVKEKTDADGALYGLEHMDKNHEVPSRWSVEVG